MAHILVIDDDPLVLESLSIGLEEDGHSVKTANDGEQGLNLIKKEKFDLVITDLIMPNKEGIETIMEIKRFYKNVKVLAISGGGRTSASSYLEMAINLGADKVLEKPFSINQLTTEIDELIT